MMKKRLITLILALCLVAGLVPATSAAMLDNGLVYEVYVDHVEITGYTGNLTELIIPSKIEGKSVTSISDYAFYWCDSLIRVIIPDSVTHIGDWAFSGCTSLTSMVLPNNLTHIGDYAFDTCSNIGSLVIPDTVTYIGDYAFYG